MEERRTAEPGARRRAVTARPQAPRRQVSRRVNCTAGALGGRGRRAEAETDGRGRREVGGWISRAGSRKMATDNPQLGCRPACGTSYNRRSFNKGANQIRRGYGFAGCVPRTINLDKRWKPT